MDIFNEIQISYNIGKQNCNIFIDLIFNDFGEIYESLDVFIIGIYGVKKQVIIKFVK